MNIHFVSYFSEFYKPNLVNHVLINKIANFMLESRTSYSIFSMKKFKSVTAFAIKIDIFYLFKNKQ